jgi:hypothetical protein
VIPLYDSAAAALGSQPKFQETRQLSECGQPYIFPVSIIKIKLHVLKPTSASRVH